MRISRASRRWPKGLRFDKCFQTIGIDHQYYLNSYPNLILLYSSNSSFVVFKECHVISWQKIDLARPETRENVGNAEETEDLGNPRSVGN